MALRFGHIGCKAGCEIWRTHQKQYNIFCRRIFYSTRSGQAKNANTKYTSAVMSPKTSEPNKPITRKGTPPTSSLSTEPLDTTTTSNTKHDTALQPMQKLSSKLVRENVKGYVFTRYFDYVKNYNKVLERNFPSTVKAYRIFFDGVKEFYADMKRYLKILRIVNESPEGLRALNRQELEIYVQMRRDMIKIAPALLGSSLPLVGYAIFPIIFMYPRTFLTSHFWSLQQRAEFAQLKMQERLNYNRPIFRFLQAKLVKISKDEKFEQFNTLLGLMGSGFHPTVEAILAVKEIFTIPPYNFISMSGKHVKLLIGMHGLSGGFFNRHRLIEHAFIVHYMDVAIQREGGVHNLAIDVLRHSCYIRGLNPINLNNDEMINWLRNWIKVSTSLKKEHLTLFLHLPLFLSYNHPNNWRLIYERKSQYPGYHTFTKSKDK